MKTKILFSLLIALISFAGFAQESAFQLSSHILDISKGLPAPDVKIKLDKMNEAGQWVLAEERLIEEMR